MGKRNRKVDGVDSVPDVVGEILQDPKAAALKYGLAGVEETLKKYEKHRRIVEAGFVRIVVFLDLLDLLDLDSPVFPLVEVTVNGLHLGYINEMETTNRGEFRLETYKRGSGVWDERSICVTPVRKWAQYYRKAKKTVRLAGGSATSRKQIAIYIPLPRRRTLWGTKRRLPDDAIHSDGHPAGLRSRQ